MIRWSPLKALIIKELYSVLRDKRARMLLIVPPLIQLFVLIQAITLEVKNSNIAYYNEDSGWYSQELIKRIEGSPYFKTVYRVNNQSDLQKAIDDQDVIVALHFQPNFSQTISKKKPASLQIIADGRRSNAAQIVNGYIVQILQNFNSDINQVIKKSYSPLVTFRSWFNPNLDYIVYTAPCLVGIISMIISLMVTALSVAREREMGTFDQILVSPLTLTEILMGKMIPAALIGITESTIMLLLMIIIYDIPFRGSIPLFYLSMVIFVISIVGIGLFISSICKTQQQALLGTFVFIVPTMLLSGFATPIEYMPVWLQPISQIIPITHFFIIVKGIFLKNIATTQVINHIWPMILIGLCTLTGSAWMFKRKLE